MQEIQEPADLKKEMQCYMKMEGKRNRVVASAKFFVI